MGKIQWWKTNFGESEIKNISDSVRKGCISQGPVTAEFEKALSKMLDVPYVTATTSGSMAMLMALIAAGIKPGDEVMVPNRTWIATAHAPFLLGAKVVLVDVEPDRPVMDVDKLEKKITKRTKAIIVVHLNGRSVAMESVRRLASSHRIALIEDAAQAFLSKNADGFLGTQSDMGCYSLAVTKLISTGQGGFVVTKDKALCERLKSMRSHGVSDLVNVSYTEPGFNFRFTDVLASIGLAQIEEIPERIKRVKAIYKTYEKGVKNLPFLKFLPVDTEKGEIPIYAEVLCQRREELMKFLNDKGIQTRPFYPDLNLAPYLRDKHSYPRSEVFGREGLFLPCGPGQSPDDIEYVIESLKRFSGHHKAGNAYAKQV